MRTKIQGEELGQGFWTSKLKARSHLYHFLQNDLWRRSKILSDVGEESLRNFFFFF